MKTDDNLERKKTDWRDALIVIGDMADSGVALQRVLASGIVSGRVANACGELFTEIAELADAADRAISGNDA